ncbi:nectin-3-like isoform X2 [Salarias fasciatus]|uniref:nectin-3-like isoform X2 n=1 Tax=Salarias fasciatus TaxID=181472 RepID=UPI0011767100|nr:nectin-3-like isoform X2 [Salarias fasciatus]
MCIMANFYRSSNLLLQLICLALLQGFAAGKLVVSPEVTGYLGRNVTLPCDFIQPNEDRKVSITQFQWVLLQPEGNQTTLVVVSKEYGKKVHDSPLKGRIEIIEHSLRILNVELTDAGLYKCSMTTYPLGPFERDTKLIVREQAPLSAGTISAIMTAVVLLVMITTAMIYLFLVRKCNSSARHRVLIDTAGPAIDVTRPSVLRRDEDLVYSDVTLKPHKGGTPSSNDKRREAAEADSVTYSEVIISPQRHR